MAVSYRRLRKLFADTRKKRRSIFAVVLACIIVCMSVVPTAMAADGDIPGYVIKGNAADSTYTLEIQIENIFAYTGRIALVYDTSKLTHDGGDSIRAFNMAANVTATAESLSDAELVSAAQGYVGMAWYCYSGVDALSAPATVATLTFTMKDGVTADDIDASTFRLRVVENGNLGPWTASAMLQGRGEDMPILYEYLTNSRPLQMEFAYDGSDRMPSDGKAVQFRCTNVLDQIVPAEMTICGDVYTTDENGVIEMVLAPGAYQYRAKADGYGDVNAVINVSDDQEFVVTFINDADLVARATNELEIGYRTGDSALRVTGNLSFLMSTDDGVTISWLSDNTAIVTNEGFVFLPPTYGVNVTIVATLTRGVVTETKTFNVYVCSSAELRPAIRPSGPSGGSSQGSSTGGNTGEVVTPPPPATTVKFTDLAGYDWAKDSIERMATVGIIKGTSETTFTPDANIKRGDFVLLLMRMFDVDVSADEAFDDVPKNSYYYEAIAQARTLGIAQGTGDNCFNPEDPITRQDMITFVMRALDKTGYLTISDARDDLSGYSDKDMVAEYAIDSMAAAVAQGLIVGSDGILNPTGNTTRAEAAVFIARIYDAHNSRGD